MLYWIHILRRGEPFRFEGSILPGIIPDRVLEMMECTFVADELELCRLCDAEGARCHVIVEPDGKKLCPVLFHDAVRPSEWKVKDVL